MLYGFNLGLLSAPPYLSQLPQRSTVSQDMALSRVLGPGDVHPAPMFFYLSPSKSSWVPPRPPGPIQVPPSPTRVPPGPTQVHPGSIFPGPGHTPFRHLEFSCFLSCLESAVSKMCFLVIYGISAHSDVGPMHSCTVCLTTDLSKAL